MLAEPATKERVTLRLPGVPATYDHGLKRLVRATIARAAFDARKDGETGSEARAWLLSEDCIYFADFGGVNHAIIRKWVISGCPDRQGE